MGQGCKGQSRTVQSRSNFLRSRQFWVVHAILDFLFFSSVWCNPAFSGHRRDQRGVVAVVGAGAGAGDRLQCQQNLRTAPAASLPLHPTRSGDEGSGAGDRCRRTGSANLAARASDRCCRTGSANLATIACHSTGLAAAPQVYFFYNQEISVRGSVPPSPGSRRLVVQTRGQRGSGAKGAIAGIAQTRNNVAPVVQSLIDRRGINL